jgi:hypothetical protein
MCYNASHSTQLSGSRSSRRGCGSNTSRIIRCAPTCTAYRTNQYAGHAPLTHEAALAEPVLHCDETTVQVLKSEKAPSTEHYMIVRAAGPPGRRIVLFDYAQTRNVETLKRVLTGPDGPYRGKLVCDGLELYDYVGEDATFAAMTLFGCLTHCRRYYDKSAKVTESPSVQQLSRVALKDFLGKVFFAERQIQEQREARERSGGVWTLAETLKIRQERSAPVMMAFKAWVDELAPAVPPKSALGKALGYTINQWDKLSRFLDHPEVPAHNNRVENDIRPFAVGRRYPRFVIMDGRRATIAHNRYLYASAGSRLHRFAFHNCRCFLLDVQPSRGEFPWFGTHVSGRDSNPAKSGLRLHRSKIQALRTLSILPSAAMRPARSRAILEALLTLFIGLLSEGFAPGTFASR